MVVGPPVLRIFISKSVGKNDKTRSVERPRFGRDHVANAVPRRYTSGHSPGTFACGTTPPSSVNPRGNRNMFRNQGLRQWVSAGALALATFAVGCAPEEAAPTVSTDPASAQPPPPGGKLTEPPVTKAETPKKDESPKGADPKKSAPPKADAPKDSAPKADAKK